MSIQITYLRLFQIALRHDYFTDGIARNIRLRPSQKTKELLQSGRMLTKQIKSSIITSFRTDNSGTDPLIDLGLNAQFEFVIEVDELPSFMKKTQLDTNTKKYTSGNFLIFTNEPVNVSTQVDNPEVLRHKVLDGVKPTLFTYSISPPSPPSSLELIVTDESGVPVSVGKDPAGASLPTTLPISANNRGEFTHSIDLNAVSTGVYTFTWKNGVSTILVQQFYVDNEYATATKMIGILRLKYESGTGHLYGNTEHYAIQFVRKETKWKYYVINKNGAVDMALNTLFISNPDGGTPPYPNVSFSASGAVPHPNIAIGDLPTAIFEADQDMPLFETPKLNLQLIEKVGTIDKTLLENLPNPTVYTSLKKVGPDEISEIYVFV
jgi:hypothetical protein